MSFVIISVAVLRNEWELAVWGFLICACVCVMCTRIAKRPFAIVTRFVSRTTLFFSEKHRKDEVGAAVCYGNNRVSNSDSGPVRTPLQL